MKKIIVAIFAMLLYFVNAYSQTIPESWTFTLKGGLTMTGPGKVNIEGNEGSPKISPLVKVDFDGILVEKLSMGLFFFFSPMGAEGFDKSANVMTIGTTIKPRFTLGDDIQIRPALAIGYQRITSGYFDKPSNGLDVGGQLEVAKYLGSGGAIVGEIGFISQPDGGTPLLKVTFPPIMYLSIGYEFGK